MFTPSQQQQLWQQQGTDSRIDVELSRFHVAQPLVAAGQSDRQRAQACMHKRLYVSLTSKWNITTDQSIGLQCFPTVVVREQWGGLLRKIFTVTFAFMSL